MKFVMGYEVDIYKSNGTKAFKQPSALDTKRQLSDRNRDENDLHGGNYCAVL